MSTARLNFLRAGISFYSFCHVSLSTGHFTRKHSIKDLIQLTGLFWKGQKAQEKEHNKYQNAYKVQERLKIFTNVYCPTNPEQKHYALEKIGLIQSPTVLPRFLKKF